jgi:hypothetical protein
MARSLRKPPPNFPAVYARAPDATEERMAHSRDKGAKDKHVKKKASKSIKEKRAEKRLKHDASHRQAGAVETLGGGS